MTSDELYDLMLSHPTTEIFEDIMTFFSQDELPKEFLDDYDALDIIFDINEDLQKEKAFNKLFLFQDLLSTKYPEIYQETFELLESVCIFYNSFHQKYEKLFTSVKQFIQNAALEPEYFSLVLQYMAANQRTEYVEQMTMLPVYMALRSSNAEENEDICYDITLHRFNMALEEQYKIYLRKQSPEWTAFNKSAKKYDLNLTIKDFSSLEKGFTAAYSPKNDILNYAGGEVENFLFSLKTLFLSRWSAKGYSFFFSGYIWDLMQQYWMTFNQQKSLQDGSFFEIKPLDISRFMALRGHGLSDTPSSNEVALLWGGVLVYDFLIQEALIDEKVHQNAIKDITTGKGKFIFTYIRQLWTLHYLQKWPISGSTSQESYIAEMRLIRKTYDLKGTNFIDFENELQEDLGQLGNELRVAIENAEENIEEETRQIFAELRNSGIGEADEPLFFDPPAPIRREQKIGRNEPCSCGSGKKYKKCCGNL